MTNFDKLIKDLEAEVEALKTLKRKSSTTLETITKRVDTSASIAFQTTSPNVMCWDAVVIRITPAHEQNILYSVSFPPYATNNRNIQVIPWIESDGTPAILAVPQYNGNDSGWGGYDQPRDVNFSLFITATDDFTITTRRQEYRHGSNY